MAPIPITILTGFLGSGKTTLLLNLIPQLPSTYRLALLKNEFGDVAIDSQLASTSSISGVRELLNGCICCNLVGQLSDALFQLLNEVNPDRIVIETSGSAFPATLAMEVNRLAREHPGTFSLDGVISVIDVENWEGYEDTSYTAKLQARYTDLIVFNKWEAAGEMKFEICLDRVEVLSVTLKAKQDGAVVDTQALVEKLLRAANKEEVYRIKGVMRCSTAAPPAASEEEDAQQAGQSVAVDADGPAARHYILNWAFGRWTFTPSDMVAETADPAVAARITFILARYESGKWKKRLEAGGLVQVAEGSTSEGAELVVERLV
ncbi:Ribosomal protein L36 family protein [Aspergillus niger]|uniref:Ribosomal protein L36 family protein n=1 Tax=Aspergillus niger TaxID=5061 RepID=A0A505HVB8_ASPNG|nr:Ribosomal protein L36 family protein [Aspergillus niger]